VPKPLLTSNVTTAALFRTIDKFRPTLLIDEADTFLGGNEELRGILNSGHFRPAAQVIRAVGKTFEPRLFSTWAPKAIALIGRLPATLEDRSVVVPLKRRARHEHVDKLQLHRLWELEVLCQKAARFARDIRPQLATADPQVPEELNDRAADNWRPLLAISDCAGGEWPNRARHVARVLSGEGEEDTGDAIQLLSDIRAYFAALNRDRASSANLAFHLGSLEDRPWKEWRGMRPISTTQVAALLKPFEIRPTKIRIGEATLQGYYTSDFADAFDRYLPPEPEQSEQGTIEAAKLTVENRNIREAVPTNGAGQFAPSYSSVPDVPSHD
jgi:hypothetical protein